MFVAGAALGVTLLVVTVFPSTGAPAASTAHRRGPVSGSFGWLMPHPAPPTWHRVATPSGGAVLAYPTSFSPIAGDAGSVSAGLTNSTGQLVAYVNVTPRQGAEELKGFGHLRLSLIGKDDDKDVRLQGTGEGLPFRRGTGSCVMDDYRTRIGNNHYREIACLVVGKHAANVVVAAVANQDWVRYRTQLRQVIASFTVS